MANQWCRLYRETVTDPKLSRLTAAQRHVWTVLMCLAIDGDGAAEIADGVGYMSDEIATLAGAEVDETVAALEWFERVGMISTDDAGVVTLLNWNQRQFKSDHDSAERQRRSRAGRDVVSRDTDDVTSRDSHSDVTHQNRDRTDTDTEQIHRKARATFKPPSVDEVRAYCKQRDNGVDAEAWMAHYEANGWKVGRNPMKDWHAAVRTWERNDIGGKLIVAPKRLVSAGAHTPDANPWNVDDIREYGGDPPKHQRWDDYIDDMACKQGQWPRFKLWLATQEGETRA